MWIAYGCTSTVKHWIISNHSADTNHNCRVSVTVCMHIFSCLLTCNPLGKSIICGNFPIKCLCCFHHNIWLFIPYVIKEYIIHRQTFFIAYTTFNFNPVFFQIFNTFSTYQGIRIHRAYHNPAYSCLHKCFSARRLFPMMAARLKCHIYGCSSGILHTS